MKISHRVANINGGGSDGWDVFLKARGMIAEGTAVTELTIGEHDIRTAAPILQEMHRSALGGHTGYAMVPGINALRDTVAARVQARTGVPTTRDNVIITPGGQAALRRCTLIPITPPTPARSARSVRCRNRCPPMPKTLFSPARPILPRPPNTARNPC